MVIKTDHMTWLRSIGEMSSVSNNPYSWAYWRIRELEAELAVRDNSANEVLRILREATRKRDFHSEMEAAEHAAKMLAEARANLAKADDELNSAAYDLERQGRELAEARRDGARLDHVIENFEDINFDGWYDHFDFAAADAAEDGNEGHRVEHRKAWRKYLDAAMEGK